ncbi:MAG: GMC family oxidoreductase, partial [Dehalococcoidia bacterium]|nr:GMC family oxidoreductase [Dehalococcoidia bacterium]
LGVNPLLTISALAERNCALLAQDYGWNISYDLPSSPSEKTESRKLGIQFTETMRGHFSTEVIDDYERAAKRGRLDESEFEFTITVVSEDVDTMLQDPNHEASIVGTVTVPVISDRPLTATGGRFNLFVRDADQDNTRQMRYRMPLTTVDGERYHMVGFKTIHDDPGFDMWEDTTTLFITVYDGDDESGRVAGRGILKIEIDDFRRQMSTMKVSNADGPVQEVAAAARFGRFFSGELWDTYGLG